MCCSKKSKGIEKYAVNSKIFNFLLLDPRIRDSSATSVSRLLQSTQELQSDVQLNVGRFINRNFEAGHEIYFLIDVSSSIKTEPQLNATLTFAVNLVKRVS